ncbi:nitroreductase family protein [Sphingosinicella rhizophila]|uniref:Putative NAD(P)H nitroreductase n=1 Tax=Sphingosinicella rhizophila TaxID=3050082 RepID=A0ABU3Q4D1_9SPHN|nr:nitroreductase [Sphingosinicella sp. GR2756]MDT9598278.1 nitroreductase [Sphingosinicella sp. GR2756]
MFNDLSSTLSLLKTRRSGRPRDLVDPGPGPEQLRDILAIAARTPDHGKLAPWRFVHVRKQDRDAFRAVLEQAYRADKQDPGRLEIEAVHRFAHQAPELVIVLSSPVEDSKIPVWEQQLSCGAACMNMLLAVHAMGFAAGWVTGWAAYSDDVLRMFGRGQERIAGFIFIGTPATALEERPRPAMDYVVSEWNPNG